MLLSDCFRVFLNLFLLPSVRLSRWERIGMVLSFYWGDESLSSQLIPAAIDAAGVKKRTSLFATETEFCCAVRFKRLIPVQTRSDELVTTTQ